MKSLLNALMVACGLWNHGQLCISDQNQQVEMSFPSKEEFWEDSSQEVSLEDSTKEA